jgi:hypothetical protein
LEISGEVIVQWTDSEPELAPAAQFRTHGCVIDAYSKTRRQKTARVSGEWFPDGGRTSNPDHLVNNFVVQAFEPRERDDKEVRELQR